MPNLGVGESLELLVVPLSGSDGAALRVDEHGVVLGTQEVSDGVAVLSRVEWHNAVNAALELHVAGEAERVADVDEGAAGLGSDETHLTGTAGARRTDLQTPLLTEEKSQGADVSVLLVTDAVLASKLRGEVVHHGQLQIFALVSWVSIRVSHRTTYSGGGGTLVAVRVLEALGASEAHSGRQSRQDDLRDSVAAANGVLKNAQIAAVLDGSRDLGAVALDLVTGDLEHLISILGASSNTSAATNRLVAVQRVEKN